MYRNFLDIAWLTGVVFHSAVSWCNVRLHQQRSRMKNVALDSSAAAAAMTRSKGVKVAENFKIRCGIKISRFSTNKSLYLTNDTRYRHSYYGRRIGTRMRSIKWCHWTNPNPVFKVTPLFDAKYLKNGYRYGHSYYRRRIGNRTQAFEWFQFQWPLWPLIQISKSRYYSTSNNSQMVQDRAIVTIAD